MATADPSQLSGAVRAFDALAGTFDESFALWRSVAAQRRAVRRELLRAFPEGSLLLELGGGTGDDALHLAERGRRVLLTDGSPAMVARARAKILGASRAGEVETRLQPIEDLSLLADERETAEAPPFDGCFSNFAALNCVADLSAVGRALARLLPARARALLVVFGPFCPSEMLLLALRKRWKSVFRRLSTGPAPARVAGVQFGVRYPSPHHIARALAPAFSLERIRGIGIFVPPSSAEPEISRFPRFLDLLERLDRVASSPLALLGDHILLDFVRTDSPAGNQGGFPSEVRSAG